VKIKLMVFQKGVYLKLVSVFLLAFNNYLEFTLLKILVISERIILKIYARVVNIETDILFLINEWNKIFISIELSKEGSLMKNHIF